MSLVSLRDLSQDDISNLINHVGSIKDNPTGFSNNLSGKKIAMIFEKPSTRTRIASEVAVVELGGNSIVLNYNDMQLGRGETVADTARVLGGYVDCIMARVHEHRTLEDLRKYSQVPVINTLSDQEHPCQIIGDLYTMMELKGRLKGLKLAYIGDGNNVCNSLLLGCALVGVNIMIASPPSHQPPSGFVNDAITIAQDSKVVLEEDPVHAVDKADIVYTDVWVSMGEEDNEADKIKAFDGYQVNPDLFSKAKNDALFMHCLPAHRGVEVTDEVIDSKSSVVWQQAENRLHAHKAILLKQFELE